MLWAREAMKRWIAFDDEWGRELRLNLFHVTGDLIMRTEWDNFQLRSKVWWDKNKIPYQILESGRRSEVVPVISMDDITAVLYEPDAGVVRARRAAHAVAAVFEKLGGKIVIGRATPSKISNGRLEEIALDTGATLRADTFVYAVGPWLGKTFPDIFAKKTRVPIGYVCYFGTPIGDHRFTYPEPSELQLPRRHRLAGAAGRQPRIPRARRRARADAAGTVAAGRGGEDAASGRGVAPARQQRGRTAHRRRRTGGRNGGERRRSRWRRWRSGQTSRRSAGAAGSRYERSMGDAGAHRWIAALRRAPLPALKDAPIAQTHACHYESTSSGNFIVDRHPQMSNVLDRRRWERRGLQVRPEDRRLRRAARDGHRGRQSDRRRVQDSGKGIRTAAAADSRQIQPRREGGEEGRPG